MNQKIELVLERFDFAKVHKVMTALQWKWITPKGASVGLEVPNQGEIYLAAKKLLQEALSNWQREPVHSRRDCCISVGGFWATVYGEGAIELSFRVEESDSITWDE